MSQSKNKNKHKRRYVLPVWYNYVPNGFKMIQTGWNLYTYIKVIIYIYIYLYRYTWCNSPPKKGYDSTNPQWQGPFGIAWALAIRTLTASWQLRVATLASSCHWPAPNRAVNAHCFTNSSAEKPPDQAVEVVPCQMDLNWFKCLKRCSTLHPMQNIKYWPKLFLTSVKIFNRDDVCYV